MIFFSYDNLTPDERAIVKEGHAMIEIAPFSQSFSLVFVLVYILVTRLQGLCFYPSVVFIILAVTLMGIVEYQENENIVASVPAKVIFVVSAILASAIAQADEHTSQR